jgi:hypothetical protein
LKLTGELARPLSWRAAGKGINTRSRNMENRFRRLVGLSKPELMAEIENMTPEECDTFRLWLQHEDDQRHARVVQQEENAALTHKVLEMLESHGFGTLGKETLGEIMPLLSHEEQEQVMEVMLRGNHG